ncbi:MAG: FTR1 family protein [Candidatus Micrarchaeia archaeon]
MVLFLGESFLPSLLITFRETLEAALVIGIILAFLEKTRNFKYNKHVYLGAAGGIVASLVLGVLFGDISKVLRGVSAELFEGGVLLFAAVLLTWMILWMFKQTHIRQEIEGKVKVELDEGHAVGLMAFVFVSVFREGIETVVFLNAAAFAAEGASLTGAVAGIAAAVILAFLLFETAMRIDLKFFFNATSILLVLFAAGLVSHAVHEFEEAGVLEEQPPLWDTKALLDEKSALGSVFRVLLGYDDRPTLFQAIGYAGYIVLVGLAFLNIDRLHKII